jgi:hypothetical protein
MHLGDEKTSGLSGGFCEESDPQVSALPLALMNQLYDIERRAMQKSDQERGELRAKESSSDPCAQGSAMRA